MSKTLIVATRASKLAYTQTEQTVEILRKANPEYNFEIKTFSTKGDKDKTTPLTQFGGTGVFVKELEIALTNGEADIAIHSLKDVPNNCPDHLELVSYPLRERVEDVLLTTGDKTIDQLKENPIIGTGSLRRRVQLKQLRPDASFVELRGNIDTRLKKLETGEYDAIVLAAAGLNRMGITYSENQVLKTDDVLPAIGQGALAIEIRKGDELSKSAVMKINDNETSNAIKVERAIMKEIEGGCKFPLAAYARFQDGNLLTELMAGDYETGRYVKLKESLNQDTAIERSIELAKELKAKCAEKGIELTFNN
jgi:hydroxymethylbilane synthase